MKHDSGSLSHVLDSIGEALFFDCPISSDERDRISLWIASLQGRPNAYADMFAPTDDDFEQGLRLFTGEMVRSRASLRHITGEESCRTLILLGSRLPEVTTALANARRGILGYLDSRLPNRDGFFCCGTCDPALWRHFAAKPAKGADRWIDYGLKTLAAHRSTDGRWRRFPFFYTMLALSELDHPAARREIKYAAAAGERFLTRARTSSTPTTRRRIAVIERAFSRC